MGIESLLIVIVGAVLPANALPFLNHRAKLRPAEFAGGAVSVTELFTTKKKFEPTEATLNKLPAELGFPKLSFRPHEKPLAGVESAVLTATRLLASPSKPALR